MAELQKCRSCNRAVKWATTTKGKLIPLDPLRRPWEPEPDVAPNAIFEPDGRVRILHKAELANAALGPRYVVHWASCPDSRRWKEFVDKRRAKKRDRLEADEHELRAASSHPTDCRCEACSLNEDLGLESLVLVSSRPSGSR